MTTPTNTKTLEEVYLEGHGRINLADGTDDARCHLKGLQAVATHAKQEALATSEGVKLAMGKLLYAIDELIPYLDNLTDYGSTMLEWKPNRLIKEIPELLAAYRKEALAQLEREVKGGKL